MAIPENTNAQAGRLGRSENHRIGKDRPAHHTETPPDVNVLLSRLDRVRQYGKGWSARCPAHEDRNASLSIAFGDDGRILAHCFAGCHISDVLESVGLQLSDLFPTRQRDQSPMARRERHEAALQAQWRAALTVLAFEAAVVHTAAHAVLHGPLSDDDRHRLTLAAERIDDARTILAPAETSRPRACA